MIMRENWDHSDLKSVCITIKYITRYIKYKNISLRKKETKQYIMRENCDYSDIQLKSVCITIKYYRTY